MQVRSTIRCQINLKWTAAASAVNMIILLLLKEKYTYIMII